MKPSQLRLALPRLMAKNRPVFLWGAPGVGKSDLIRTVAEDGKLELRDVRLSLLDPVDLKGFPTINAAKKQMTWLPADFLPTKGKGLLFLDEMNSAPQSVQAAAYQLVLNRKIGDYTLPAGWSILAAGNRTSDRSVVHAMPAALANRFVHLDYDVNVDDWSEWAVTNEIHADVRAFIRFRPNLLHSFDSASNPRAFPSPRSWAFVNDIYKDHLSQDIEFEIIKGTIGEAASAEFSAFVRLIKDLPSIESILANPLKAKLPSNPSAKYAITTALDAKATMANVATIMQYVSRLDVEFQVLFMRGAIRRDNKIGNTKTFIEWGAKNGSMFS